MWMTANVRYVLDVKSDSVDYIGRKVDKIGVVLATGKTTAAGAFTTPLKVPKDFGGLHDIYAVVDGVQVAKGGFLLERTVTISPKKGPVGTPITVSVVGMGSPTYESVGAVLYDNHYAGAVSANTTRGVTTFKIRASGKPGAHWIEYAGSSHTVPYLNMEQSPVPWTDSHRVKFTVTKDAGVPKTYVENAVSVTPTVSARTTVIDADVAKDSTAKVTIDSNRGPILSKTNVSATGLTPNAPVQISLDLGRRQQGQLHRPVLEVHVAAPRAGDRDCERDARGAGHDPGRARRLARDPARPGRQGHGPGAVLREAELREGAEGREGRPALLRRAQGRRLDAARQHARGSPTTTATSATPAGSTRTAYVRVQLFATGEPGTHLIDLYPLLYTQQPAYPYSQLGMVPLLGFARDAPGLAAGYDIPAIRLAIKVVK